MESSEYLRIQRKGIKKIQNFEKKNEKSGKNNMIFCMNMF